MPEFASLCPDLPVERLEGQYTMQERRSVEISRPSAVQTRLKWYRGNSIHRMSIDKLNIRTVNLCAPHSKSPLETLAIQKPQLLLTLVLYTLTLLEPSQSKVYLFTVYSILLI